VSEFQPSAPFFYSHDHIEFIFDPLLVPLGSASAFRFAPDIGFIHFDRAR
jgi:hypothetical protein